MTILVLIGMVFGIIWEAFHGISWNVVLLLLLMNFVSGFRLDWCIYPSSYQAKPHSSPWFSAACAAAIFYRNHFFCLYQQNKSSKSKVKFRHAINHCKRFPSHPKNLALRTFGELLIVFSTKVNLLYLLYSTDWRCCQCVSDKVKRFAENFSNNSNLNDTGISLPIFLSRTNLTLHNISVTPKIVKKVITNLDLSSASGPICIPVLIYFFLSQ